MTKIKKIVAATVAALAIGTIGTGAYASTYALPKYKGNFNFKFTGQGGIQYTNIVEKGNSSANDAKVQATGGYVSESSYITVDVSYYPPYSNIREIATYSEEITSPVDNLSLKYKVARGQGSQNFLVGLGSYYAAEAVGTWEP